MTTTRDRDWADRCELEVCDGSGSYPVQNGSDDFDYELCACPIGQKIAAGETDQYDPERFYHQLDASPILDWFNSPSPFEK